MCRSTCAGDCPGLAAHRPCAQRRRVRRASALADRQGLRRRIHPQRHRHRRQDPQQGRRRGQAVVGVGRHLRAGLRPGVRRARRAAAVGRAAGHRAHHPDNRADRTADRRGPRLCQRRRRLLRRAEPRAVRRVLRAPRRRRAPGRGRATCKRDQRDFTLWKGASRASRRGRRRGGPVAPAGTRVRRDGRGHLGPAFDIHAGGMDLVFPHHENEIAQAKASATASRATGCTTAGSPWAARR